MMENSIWIWIWILETKHPLGEWRIRRRNGRRAVKPFDYATPPSVCGMCNKDDNHADRQRTYANPFESRTTNCLYTR